MNEQTIGDLIKSLALLKAGKVTRSVHVYPKLEGWDLLEAHIFATQSLVLLEKRIAVTPYREMLTLRREVPGVIPYEKRKLTFRPMNNED
jgi:hypothetical protein